MLADRIEAIVAETGQTGFHFVDEAAPPKSLKALAQEVLSRKLAISWWGNIRYVVDAGSGVPGQLRSRFQEVASAEAVHAFTTPRLRDQRHGGAAWEHPLPANFRRWRLALCCGLTLTCQDDIIAIMSFNGE